MKEVITDDFYKEIRELAKSVGWEQPQEETEDETTGTHKGAFFMPEKR